MALLKLKQLAVSATDSRTALSATNLWARQVVIQNANASAGEVCYIGDVTVTSSTGIQIAAQGVLSIDPNNASNGSVQQINLKNIHVICAATDVADLRVLYLVEEDS